MIISRRDLIKTSLAAGTAASMPSIIRAQTAPTATRTVRVVKSGDLRVFDPIFTTAGISAEHGLAIYDTLFSLDSKLTPQPQMVGKWSVSDDKKAYTFELRDGLGWHDGTPVTAADCVASIRRWAEVAPGGKLIMARAQDISKKDDKTFTIALKEPLGTLIDLLTGVATPFLFIMREKDATRPATEQVTANIGSGPFRFNEALAKPGASFTYDRNEKYVPRSETSDGFSGGKIVKVDRVIWENIANQQTAFAALRAGEIDYQENLSSDLYSAVESDPNLTLQLLDKSGYVQLLLMNSLQKPFNSVKARQAMLHLVDQEACSRINTPDPKYSSIVTSMFGNTLYSNDENTGWYKKGGDPEQAKQLFKESGYAGEKVVILQPTNFVGLSNVALFLAGALRKIGINAEVAPSDWGGVITRRSNRGPVETGGWSIIVTSVTGATLAEPLTTPWLTAEGDKGFTGWARNDEYEALRAQWGDTATLAERQALARKMQRVWWDFAPQVVLGQGVYPIARRKALTGLIGMPIALPMWNMQKA
ncbi:ABC transporter substrate-binding protein [Bradyrhizobium sp. CSS354]|uniref:ABC transporter substrate-binding protein n=1 Tax=Bradyrhizobium sp. CSS354 TaxID=2699172 RepID=UPI0023B1E3F3|nr:ABC transporter substrate-binding protein [Bradyrhizobium sp. CSS354]MDE5466245.1 ABC transporter substrate-binding protein [Bradyrhizobium sp. CSS354]